MVILPGKGDDLRLYAGAVARSNAVYLTVVERCLIEVTPQHLMAGRRRLREEAGSLGRLQSGHLGEEREVVPSLLALLPLAEVKVDRPTIQPHRRAGLHPIGPEAQPRDLLREAERGRLGDASPGDLHAADVHQAIEEGPVGEDHRLRFYPKPHGGDYAGDRPTLVEQLHDSILPEGEVGRLLEISSPQVRKPLPIALRAGTPHRRSLAPIEHPKLHRRPIGDDPHQTAEGIQLAHDLPLGYAPHGGVARHLGDLVEIHGDEEGTGAEHSRRMGRLTAGMAGTDHDNIIG